MKPRLKEYRRSVAPGEVFLRLDVGVEMTLEDPDGRVGALVDLLDGSRTVDEIAAALNADSPIDLADVEQAIAALDDAGLLEDADAPTGLTSREEERYASNLEFFATFAGLGVSRYAFQDRLRRSHVVLLGAGGLGSTLLLNLAGMGVGRVTVVDFDQVELKNLARQFLYRERDVGRSKVACAIVAARALNSDIEITGVDERIEDPDAIVPLVADASLVLSAIDHPWEAPRWVNDACVPAGVPFVTGGFQAARGMYGSVDPGRSGCLACLEARDDGDAPFVSGRKVNRGIGPVATVTGSLIALEALRYLSGFAQPVAAGKYWVIDFATGRLELGAEWERLPDCPVCRDRVPSRQRALVATDAA